MFGMWCILDIWLSFQCFPMLPAAGAWMETTGSKCPTCQLLLEEWSCLLCLPDPSHQVLSHPTSQRRFHASDLLPLVAPSTQSFVSLQELLTVFARPIKFRRVIKVFLCICVIVFNTSFSLQDILWCIVMHFTTRTVTLLLLCLFDLSERYLRLCTLNVTWWCLTILKAANIKLKKPTNKNE